MNPRRTIPTTPIAPPPRTSAPLRPTADPRPRYRVVLLPLRTSGDVMLDLRQGLKRLLRNHGLKCLSIEQVEPEPLTPPNKQGEKR